MRGYPTFPIETLGAGIGLKPQHYLDALQSDDAIPSQQNLWFEVHTENYFVDGGPRLEYLKAFRELYPISFHGVGASLGGKGPLDPDHLNRVKKLVKEFEPTLVSEHAVWSKADEVYFSELLPLSRTKAALTQLVDGIDRYQNAIGRKILVENPTNYLQFRSELNEPDFLVEAATRAGCGLLLDVNNLYLSGQNCGFDCDAYIKNIPIDLVGEIHIAGYDIDPMLGDNLLIDSHASDVAEPVWSLLGQALERFGALPVLLERDDNIPSYAELLLERNRAQQLINIHTTTSIPNSTLEQVS